MTLHITAKRVAELLDNHNIILANGPELWTAREIGNSVRFGDKCGETILACVPDLILTVHVHPLGTTRVP